MSEQQSTETPSSEVPPSETVIDQNVSASTGGEELEKLNESEKISPSSENKDETKIEGGQSAVPEQQPARRITMPQDIRYATEQGDREKMMEKYSHYEVSDSNACNIRFLSDNRQKKQLVGRNEDEISNMHRLAKSFDVVMFPGYQHMGKHSYKIFGTEANVRKCLIEIMTRMFKRPNRSMPREDEQNKTNDVPTQPTPSADNGATVESENVVETPPTSIFVTTINADASITEEQRTVTPATPDVAQELEKDDEEEKGPEVKDSSTTERAHIKFTPLERKPEYTFVMLITSQGQEVLKKNWSFFAGSLQQRLQVVLANPVKLPKFGDKQVQIELAITGEIIENLSDAVLQLAAFINEVLGVPVQPYKAEDEQTSGEHYGGHQRTNNNEYHQQRRFEYNNGYRSSPGQHQGQSSPFNYHQQSDYNQYDSQQQQRYHERPLFYRGRSGAFEQMILIRSNCVARVVGTRGSNLRRIQTKCHLRDINVARHANENGYVECTLAAYQPRNLGFAIDTIRSSLRNEDDGAIQLIDLNQGSGDIPSQPSPHVDQPQLGFSHDSEHPHQQQAFPHDQPQQPGSITAQLESRYMYREPGFMIKPLHLGNGCQPPQPSYNFQNTASTLSGPPSFDFTHRPTSASRKTDKRPGDLAEFSSTGGTHPRTPSDQHHQHYGGSSSSNSSSVSPRHKSKRACPETKEIDCTTDEGFWIHKQYYHALDETSKQTFDELLDKLEKIRIATEENAAKKQQRLVGRSKPNKSRALVASTSSTAANVNLAGDSNENNHKVEPSTSENEQQTNQEPLNGEQESTTVVADQK